MANSKADIEIKKFADHHVITQPNPLRKVLRRVADDDIDDPVARAEKALAAMSGDFKDWMVVESERLSAAYAAILAQGFSEAARGELFRAAHDIKGDAVTFGFPPAGAVAESLCRIIEHAPDLSRVPTELIDHHVKAIEASAVACAASPMNISRASTATGPSISRPSWRRASCRRNKGRGQKTGARS
jgi:hypothetical protein